MSVTPSPNPGHVWYEGEWLDPANPPEGDGPWVRVRRGDQIRCIPAWELRDHDVFLSWPAGGPS